MTAEIKTDHIWQVFNVMPTCRPGIWFALMMMIIISMIVTKLSWLKSSCHYRDILNKANSDYMKLNANGRDSIRLSSYPHVLNQNRHTFAKIFPVSCFIHWALSAICRQNSLQNRFLFSQSIKNRSVMLQTDDRKFIRTKQCYHHPLCMLLYKKKKRYH